MRSLGLSLATPLSDVVVVSLGAVVALVASALSGDSSLSPQATPKDTSHLGAVVALVASALSGDSSLMSRVAAQAASIVVAINAPAAIRSRTPDFLSSQPDDISALA